MKSWNSGSQKDGVHDSVSSVEEALCSNKVTSDTVPEVHSSIVNSTLVSIDKGFVDGTSLLHGGSRC